jgi:hypothetical protein
MSGGLHAFFLAFPFALSLSKGSGGNWLSIEEPFDRLRASGVGDE